MDKNTFSGLFLILIIIIGFTYLTRTPQQDLNKEQHLQDSLALVRSGKAPARLPKAASAASAASAVVDTSILHGSFPGALTQDNKVSILENEHLKVKISSKGGRILSVELKEFKTYDQKPLILFDGEDNKFGIRINEAGKVLNTNDLHFTSDSQPVTSVSGDNSSSVSFRLTYADGKFIDYIYSLTGNSYKVGFTIAATGMEDLVGPQHPILLDWEASLKQKEKDLAAEQRSSTAYYQQSDNEVDHLSATKDESKTLGDKGKIKWISFKQHFFSNVLIPRNGFTKATIRDTTPVGGSTVKQFAAHMQLNVPAGDVASIPMEFYFGPNKFSTLQKQGHYLEKQVELGYWPLKYINRFIVLPVFTFLDRLDWNYGIIILVLTMLLKLVLSPLTYKSYLSMAKMRVLKPEMDEIKEKVGEDNPTLLQQEYLKLYKKAGVNPLGGCIPMLLQLPIVMAFFFFFPNLFELRQESFLWMKDLSTYDAFIRFNFTIPFIGNHISLMCILMTISTLIYTYFNNQISGATGQMKYIGYISPIIFLGVLNSYPSGLNYYYFLANMLTFAQQFVIRQMVDDSKIHAQIQENKKKPQTAKKKSGFQQRMEDYMRDQQGKGKQAALPKGKK